MGYPRKTVSETWAETAKSTGKWGGIVGPTDHIASGQEWQTILQTRDGGGAVYYGMGRALSYCPPSLVAGLSLSGCKMLLLLDRAENDASNRRQSKLDNQKTAAQLALEQPFQTAALFSMAGVNTVMLNQWSNTLHANRRLMLGWLAVMKERKITLPVHCSRLSGPRPILQRLALIVRLARKRVKERKLQRKIR